ncbi:hypothetical protein TWF281_005696 [Arthrobotrys megalospora]
MDTPKSSTYDPSVAGLDQNDLSQRLKMNPKIPELTLNDGPWPGHIYVISYMDTPRVFTYHSQRGVTLMDYEGSVAQRWICHSQDGWLGFVADPGDTTAYIGHIQKKLRCCVNHHKKNEMFSVRKRLKGLDGFQVLMRFEDSLHPIGIDGDGDVAMIKGSDAWWGFTMIA